LAILPLVTCSDPIFYAVSREIAQREPLIKGSPTNFVEFDDNIFDGAMYVASGKNIWKYKNGSWSSHGQNRWIAQLAATEKFLYALCDDNSVIRFDPSLSPSYSVISNAKSIFAAKDVLFFSNNEGNDSYSISYRDDSGATGVIATGVSMLKGAAYDGVDTYYLSTNGSGTFCINENSLDLAERINNDTNFIGIISLDTSSTPHTVVGITRNGNLHRITSSGISSITGFDDRLANGALALWRKDKNNSLYPALLLAGRQDRLTYTADSGYTYGYQELVLDETTGEISGSSFNEPGKASPSTVGSDNESYMSSLGKNPVNHIFQAKDGVLFASTQKNGVWSYRERDGLWQWNAED